MVGIKIQSSSEEEKQEETLREANTYVDYVPAKLKFGQPHPDPIVETASLSNVPPPDIYYQLHLPAIIVKNGFLSALQLESIVYSCQQHECTLKSGERAGFLIGDGPGVGKGRTISGCIFENYMCGRMKALWVSYSADLKEDAKRDLKDIGADFIDVIALNRLPYTKIQEKKGVLFSTYFGLIGESKDKHSRFQQIVEWLGSDFDGLIIFDECHRAKNLCPTGSIKPTKTGLTVARLQDELKKARIIYASATGASEPKNMAYMTRLGIWGPGTPFRVFKEFTKAIEQRGIEAMEIVAMDMKLRGAYVARQLSFKGVSFTIKKVPLEQKFKQIYDESVKLWVEAKALFKEAEELIQADKVLKKKIWGQFWGAHQRFFKYLCIASKVDEALCIARTALEHGQCVVIGLQSTGEARTAEENEREEIDAFISTAKGVFRCLVEKHFPVSDCNSSNADIQYETSMCDISKPAKTQVKNKRARYSSNLRVSASDRSVIVDSKTSDSEVECLNVDVYSYVKALKRKSRGKPALTIGQNKTKDMNDNVDITVKMKNQLLKKIEKLQGLPLNTIDYLINQLGGTSAVAEITGRKMRLVEFDNGKVECRSRAEHGVKLEQINIAEKERFMDGTKLVAIISEAASRGISLQSDRRAKNNRPRVHITLELPWSADRAIQQFWRTHRSNQVTAPKYMFLISELAGENRFASIVAKRLESLGALTHGDRRATETRDLSRFNINNRFGKRALKSVMQYITAEEKAGEVSEESEILIPPSFDYKGDFRSDVTEGFIGVGLIVENEVGRFPHKDYLNMSKFLNRILGMRVSLQNKLFDYFADTLAVIIEDAKKQGRFDRGTLNLVSDNGKTSLTKTKRFYRKNATGLGVIELHQVQVERGMSWKESLQKYKKVADKTYEGYYVAKETKSGKKTAIFVKCDIPSSSSRKKQKNLENENIFTVFRPSTGLQLQRETLEDIQTSYSLTSPNNAKEYWNMQYESSRTQCTHAFWAGKCRNVAIGIDCDTGKRTRTHYVLSGSVLLCWDDVEKVLADRTTKSKIQIVRVQVGDGTKFVGLMIPTDAVDSLERRLHKAEVAEDDGHISDDIWVELEADKM